MYLSQDWLMRQIQMLGIAIAQLLFGKDSVTYEIEDEKNLTKTDLIYRRLRELIAERSLCAAENLLYAEMDTENRDYLQMAVDFYLSLNGLTDQELDAADFSREEVESGLRDVMKQFDISIPGI
ncbi:MAG: DUF6483 family protein [Evtepia sp.]